MDDSDGYDSGGVPWVRTITQPTGFALQPLPIIINKAQVNCFLKVPANV